MALPRIWFERPILPDLEAEVAEVATVLGPGTSSNPFGGMATAGAAIAGSREYDAAVMDVAPELRVICRTGIGVDKVDIAEATRRGIAVCNSPDGPTVSTAEHAVGLMLAAAKQLTRSQAMLLAGEVDSFGSHSAIELDGKVLGLVGYGRIPRRVARIAHGIGMTVVAYDPHLAVAAFAGARRADTLAELLAAADVVSLHVPLTPETRRFFGESAFAAMKPGAVFINTARGGIVDQVALLAAIDSGHLMSVGLDVTDPEPLPVDHPLLNRDNVIVTPHVASGTYEGKRRMFRTALAQAVQVLRGERPPHLVNPEVWDALVARGLRPV